MTDEQIDNRQINRYIENRQIGRERGREREKLDRQIDDKSKVMSWELTHTMAEGVKSHNLPHAIYGTKEVGAVSP